MLRRALILALAASAFAPAAAHATGVFQKAGPTVIYTAAPGDIDQIAAFETPTTIRFTRFGGASFGPGPGCNFLAERPQHDRLRQERRHLAWCSTSATATTSPRSTRR